MKRVLALVLMLVLLFGMAKADYVEFDTDVFEYFAGFSDDDVFEKLGKNLVGALGIYIANELENSKSFKFTMDFERPFSLAIGTSRLDNGLWYMISNKRTGNYRTGYIDFNEGKMYVETKELPIDDAAPLFSFNTDDGYVYGEDDLNDIIEYLNENF